jgi:hypothetical protein
MTPEEIKSKIRDFIDGIIKDDSEAQKSAMHDVMTAKSQAVIRGPEETEVPPEPTPEPSPAPTPTPTPGY